MVVAILIAACVFMLSNIATGKFIGYPPIDRGDNPPGCDPNYPGSCQPPQPANSYKRGCTIGSRCKRVPPLPTKINIQQYQTIACLNLHKQKYIQQQIHVTASINKINFIIDKKISVCSTVDENELTNDKCGSSLPYSLHKLYEFSISVFLNKQSITMCGSGYCSWPMFKKLLGCN